MTDLEQKQAAYDAAFKALEQHLFHGFKKRAPGNHEYRRRKLAEAHAVLAKAAAELDQAKVAT